MQVATVGAVGIPWIGDLNGDSYPEIFVPQGNKLHIYAYDYVTSAADPPASALVDDESSKPVKNKPIKSRAPYYRPSVSIGPVFQGGENEKKPAVTTDKKETAATEKPEAEKEETKEEEVKKEDVKTEVLNKIQNPVQPNSYQANPNIPVTLFNGKQTVVAKPYSRMQNGQIVYQVDTASSGATNQQPFIVVNQQTANSQPVAPSQTTNKTSDQIQPGSQFQVIPQQPTFVQPQPVYMPNPFLNPFNPFGQMMQPQIVPQPFYVVPPSTSLITPKTTKSTSKPTESTPKTTTEERTTSFLDAINIADYRAIKQGPEYLKLTNALYETHDVAVVSCQAMDRKLCSLKELQYALTVEHVIPDTVWGWYEVGGRAAKLESCVPGNVKFEGMECFNGDIIHTPIRKNYAFKSFCCATVNDAILTKDKYMTHDEAYVGCRKHDHHLCTYQEMFKVYTHSTYKDLTWGWYHERNKMIRMSKQCNENDEPWQGYKCHEGLFETSPVRSRIEESAYCCPNNSTKINISLFTLISLILLTTRLS